MKNDNIERFGKLKDCGEPGDGKRTYIGSEKDDGWKRISIEIDTDDCDRKHALRFKSALIALWNAQGNSDKRVSREEAFVLAMHAGVQATERIDEQCMATGVQLMTQEQRQVLAGQVALNFVEFLRSVSVQVTQGDDFVDLTDDNLPEQFLQWLKTSGFGAA